LRTEAFIGSVRLVWPETSGRGDQQCARRAQIAHFRCNADAIGGMHRYRNGHRDPLALPHLDALELIRIGQMKMRIGAAADFDYRASEARDAAALQAADRDFVADPERSRRKQMSDDARALQHAEHASVEARAAVIGLDLNVERCADRQP
jgi:hypothetical protein